MLLLLHLILVIPDGLFTEPFKKMVFCVSQISMVEDPVPIFSSGVSSKVTLILSNAPALQPALSYAENVNSTSPAAISAAVGCNLELNYFHQNYLQLW